MKLIRIMDSLARDAERLRFGLPITQVYNPLEYAHAPHVQYLKRYGIKLPAN